MATKSKKAAPAIVLLPNTNCTFNDGSQPQHVVTGANNWRIAAYVAFFGDVSQSELHAINAAGAFGMGAYAKYHGPISAGYTFDLLGKRMAHSSGPNPAMAWVQSADWAQPGIAARNAPITTPAPKTATSKPTVQAKATDTTTTKRTRTAKPVAAVPTFVSIADGDKADLPHGERSAWLRLQFTNRPNGVQYSEAVLSANGYHARNDSDSMALVAAAQRVARIERSAWQAAQKAQATNDGDSTGTVPVSNESE